MQANEQFLKRTFYQYLPPTILSVLGGTINVMTDSLIVGNVLGEKEKCLESGMNDFLPKPIRRADLLEVLKKYISV